jgi:hypothetical protein
MSAKYEIVTLNPNAIIDLKPKILPTVALELLKEQRGTPFAITTKRLTIPLSLQSTGKC